jgi:tRNA(Ile)-lysidine synthase
LGVTRAEIEQYCAAHDLKPRFDRSNLDTTIFRNHLRLNVLPLLEAAAPNIRNRLRQTASIVAADYEVLGELRDRVWDEVVQDRRPTAIVFNRSAWRRLPVALQRATIRHAAFRVRRTLRDVSFTHTEEARQVAMNGETGAQATLPMGLILSVGYNTVTVGAAGDLGPPPAGPLLWTQEPLPVQVPGVTELPESHWALRISPMQSRPVPQDGDDHDRWTVYADLTALVPPVVLRTRRLGDRFRPSGMGGHTVKLSAFMINRKIPRAWRDHLPLLVADNEIIWVCGYREGEAASAGLDSRELVELRFSCARPATQGL